MMRIKYCAIFAIRFIQRVFVNTVISPLIIFKKSARQATEATNKAFSFTTSTSLDQKRYGKGRLVFLDPSGKPLSVQPKNKHRRGHRGGKKHRKHHNSNGGGHHG